MLGINVQDNSEDALAFLDEFHTTYPQLRSVGDERSEAFGSTGVPENFLVDPQGQAGADPAGPGRRSRPARERRPDRRRLLMARLACLILAAVAVFPTVASAKVNISDVEDEVMCPICGTLLELSDSPQARREKAFIAEMIAAGKSKAQIEDALVRGVRPRGPGPAGGIRLRALRVPGAGDRPAGRRRGAGGRRRALAAARRRREAPPREARRGTRTRRASTPTSPATTSDRRAERGPGLSGRRRSRPCPPAASPAPS